MLKHTGELPIIGVNTFRNPHGDACRTSWSWPAPPTKKKQSQLSRLNAFHAPRRRVPPMLNACRKP
jgi:methylmalonyl-CoA mutase